MYNRLTKIDDATRSDHYYLDKENDCYYMGEYTARKGYSYSKTNQLIINFKKPVKTQGTAQWEYKQRAIRTVGSLLVRFLGKLAGKITLVPVPPSKCKTDARYDGRLLESLNIAKQKIPELDFRELIIQTESTEAAHEATCRPKPEDLKNIYTVDTALMKDIRRNIIIVDDMLTTGCHYKAMVSTLEKHCREQNFLGLFIARRVPDTDSMFEDLTLE